MSDVEGLVLKVMAISGGVALLFCWTALVSQSARQYRQLVGIGERLEALSFYGILAAALVIGGCVLILLGVALKLGVDRL